MDRLNTQAKRVSYYVDDHENRIERMFSVDIDVATLWLWFLRTKCKIFILNIPLEDRTQYTDTELLHRVHQPSWLAASSDNKVLLDSLFLNWRRLEIYNPFWSTLLNIFRTRLFFFLQFCSTRSFLRPCRSKFIAAKLITLQIHIAQSSPCISLNTHSIKISLKAEF